MHKDKVELEQVREIAKSITEEDLKKDYKEYRKIRKKRGYDIYLVKNGESMELENAKGICEDFINENKSRPIILHKAIKTILKELENSIPIKKIENKIEELKRKKLPNGRLDLDIKNEAQINILRELLEEK